MGQYKFEVKAKNWFVRAYTTQENSGDSYNATIAAQFFNEAWQPSTNWYPIYTSAFTQNMAAGQTVYASHLAARAAADANRPTGPIYTKQLFQQIVQTPIGRKVPGLSGVEGAMFLDRTSLYSLEAQYNLTDALGLAKTKTEFLVGGNLREYVLNSQGTLFADTAGNIKIKESGAYAQLSQKLFNDIVKLSVSGRYDKNSNFDGRFTPRASAVIKLAKDHNLRMSYQQAYRFPSTQNQWISLVIGGSTILSGGLQQMIDYYKLNSSPVYSVTGSVITFKPIRPENSSSYEFGYKGLISKRLLIDAYFYFATYKDFITTANGLQVATGKKFSVAQNADGTVKTNGWGASVEYLLPANYSVSANVYSDQISDQPSDPTFVSYFNTPKTRLNLGLSNSGLSCNPRIGFNVTYRWQDSFNYEGTFAVGQVPSAGVVDGMISYKFPAIKSLVKVGASNVFNHYYINGLGNAQVGGIYYVSFAYNVF